MSRKGTAHSILPCGSCEVHPELNSALCACELGETWCHSWNCNHEFASKFLHWTLLAHVEQMGCHLRQAGKLPYQLMLQE